MRTCIGILLVLAILGEPGTALAGDPPRFVLKFGGWGNDLGKLFEPKGIAIDATGNIWVGDENERLQSFSRDGVYQNVWGPPPLGQYWCVGGIAFDTAGNAYTTTVEGGLNKFDPAGNLLLHWGTRGMHGVAVEGGAIYVVNFVANSVQVFTPDSTLVSTIPVCQGPSFIAFDGAGNFFVTCSSIDGTLCGFEKYSTSGQRLGSWLDRTGSGNSQFRSPNGVAVDENNIVYIADRNNFRVQVFSDAGEYLTQLGGYGYEDGQFQAPVGIAIDPSGGIYVVDELGHNVQKFAYPTSPVTPTSWGAIKALYR